MKLPMIPPGLAGKIVKYRLLSEPIRLQDLEDSTHSQAWKETKIFIDEIKEQLWRKSILEQNNVQI